MRASNCGIALGLRIWPKKAKKRGSRERSSPPCQVRTLILPRCPEARGNIDLDLTLTRKSCGLSGHAAQPSRITSAHHQTVFKPPFMTASAPPLAFMIVNSGPRWLPEPEPSAQVGAGVPPKGADWPSAAILRWASKWCASSLEESSRLVLKAVENFDGPRRRAANPDRGWQP